MKKTGQLLKDKREAANLSISEVALSTKINPKILKAIENGEEQNLPAKTFLKGFLRAYAVYLKLDAEEVLRLYQDETGVPAVAPTAATATEPTKPAAQASNGRRRMDQENSSGLRTAAVIVIVMLIGVIIGVRELIEKYQREKIVESADIKVSPLEQPPVESAAEAPTGVATPGTPAAPMEATVPPTAPVVAVPANEVVPPAESEVKPAQNEVVVAPTPAAPVVASAPMVAVTPPPPAPVVKPSAQTPALAPAPSPAPAPAAKPEPVKAAETPAKTEPTSPIKNIKAEIILEALDKVDVKIQIKGETKRLSLAPTQVHTIRVDQPVVFDFSDGGAVNIILNGRERGPAGELGKPKQLKIP